MKSPITVLIVDDHSMVRVGLAVPINSQPDMNVIAEASSAPEAIAQYRLHRPEVVIMDYRLGRHTGVQATEAIRVEFPSARILFLSAYEGEEDIYRAAKAGACGYLPKSVEGDFLLSAIRRIYLGETVFPPALATKLRARNKRETLTNREITILRHIVDGRSNKEIATRLSMSEPLVKLDVRKILDKLGAHDRTRAATLAIERGIVHLEEG